MPKNNKFVQSKVGFGQHKFKKGSNKEQQIMLAEHISIAEEDHLYGYDENSEHDEDETYLEDLLEDQRPENNDDKSGVNGKRAKAIKEDIEAALEQGFFGKRTDKVTDFGHAHKEITSLSVSSGK